jgi:hypothetical protein
MSGCSLSSHIQGNCSIVNFIFNSQVVGTAHVSFGCGPRAGSRRFLQQLREPDGPAWVNVDRLGSALLGWEELVRRALKDNPLGQGAEQTPVGLLRRLI